MSSQINDDLKKNICRKDLYIWALENEALVKVISAHFQRILNVIPLTSGRENCVITSSLDRSIKVMRVMLSRVIDDDVQVWDLSYIFEDDHHIDKQELTIDSISLSTKAGIAATVTRSTYLASRK